jgi:hypothetical protein
MKWRKRKDRSAFMKCRKRKDRSRIHEVEEEERQEPHS